MKLFFIKKKELKYFYGQEESKHETFLPHD